MGFNPVVRDVATFANEDRRWIATLMGYDQCRSITLDVSTFPAALLTKTGALPSGLVLAKAASGGKYVPYITAALDSTAVAVGFLFNSVNLVADPTFVDDPATAADPGATLYWGPGIINMDYLPVPSPNWAAVTGAAGKLDAAAIVDLGVHLRFEGTVPA